MSKLFGVIAAALLLTACDPSRVFEENVDLAGEEWVKDEAVSFTIDVSKGESYNVFTNIRNAQHYPYHNLYYRYELLDSAGNEIAGKLENIILFEPKTGEPLGSGLGDLFDHRQLILGDFQFPYTGEFQLKFEQYMRTDTLPLIISVGARLEKAEVGS